MPFITTDLMVQLHQEAREEREEHQEEENSGVTASFFKSNASEFQRLT